MGKFQVGILGGFEGKVGTVVGGRWKGIDYMRHKGRKSTKPSTQAQLEQQARFSLITKFIAKLGKLFMRSFKDTPELTGSNVAFRYAYDNALTGVYPSYSIDYSKVLISKGELQNAGLPTATASGAGNITFDWQDNTSDTMAYADDNAVIVVYCPELDIAVYTKAGAQRSTKTHTFNVVNFTGKIVHSWISFLTSDQKTYATSIYTGELTVS